MTEVVHNVVMLAIGAGVGVIAVNLHLGTKIKALIAKIEAKAVDKSST